MPSISSAKRKSNLTLGFAFAELLSIIYNS
jgi:hypothetical protein